ncbi:MAG: hypothetical protein GXO73_01080 [Calditrichaeota bacterium]|nr:hypothetical protein [Calditrichota bacterium]
MELASVTRKEYEDFLTRAAEEGRGQWREVIRAWREQAGPNPLWGYNPPQMPLRLAFLLSYLRAQGLVAPEASTEVLEILRAFSDLRSAMGQDFAKVRAETRDLGLPVFVNIFYIPLLARTIDLQRKVGDLSPEDLAWLEQLLPDTVNVVFAHPEWGAMNRAILRSEGLMLAAQVLPRHPDAPRWRRMAEIIADDNLDRWEIEDATTYHPVWLVHFSRYLELTGQLERLQRPPLRWYLDYFVELIAPHGTVPDFGDGEWRSTWFLLVAVFELAARELRDGRYKWVAARIFRSCRENGTLEKLTPSDVASHLVFAHQWCDDTVALQEPDTPSKDLDELIAKKVVFRNGWSPKSTYLLLNYRDEGDWGWLDRQYLRDTISVEEEKMHHGHADENSVVFLMSEGALLLHDAGYRSDLPSGRFGAYRADYFHNRLVVRAEKLDRDQDVYELLRNSGAYRPVRTKRIDFARLKKIDYSRTRVEDDRLGYTWDRIVVYRKEAGDFVVVDAFAPTRDDYFTPACLWHTQVVLERGDNYILGGYTHMFDEKLPDSRRLLVQFLDVEPGRRRGVFEIERHYDKEWCFYEAFPSHFLAGRWTIFVTRLVPVESSANVENELGRARLLQTSWNDAAVALTFGEGTAEPSEWLVVKLDLERERLRENVRPRYTFESGAVTAGPITTDAHLAHVWRDASGLSFSATVVTELRWKDRTIFQVPLSTFGLQLDGQPDREGRAKWRLWEDTVTED